MIFGRAPRPSGRAFATRFFCPLGQKRAQTMALSLTQPLQMKLINKRCETFDLVHHEPSQFKDDLPRRIGGLILSGFLSEINCVKQKGKL